MAIKMDETAATRIGTSSINTHVTDDQTSDIHPAVPSTRIEPKSAWDLFILHAKSSAQQTPSLSQMKDSQAGFRLDPRAGYRGMDCRWSDHRLLGVESTTVPIRVAAVLI